MATKQELKLPIEPTVAQLERLCELVMCANSQKPNPDDHNLGRYLQEHLAVASNAHGFRRAG